MRFLRCGGNAAATAAGHWKGRGGRSSCQRASSCRSDVAAETLEKRILPAVTLTIDYSLDSSGFFNVQARRDAIQAVANEIGARLNDDLGAVATRTMAVTDPSSYINGIFTATTSRTFALAANELRIFVGGAAMSGGTVGVGGWRSHSGIRSFDANNEFEPYVGHIAFDNDGSTQWSYDDAPAFDETNFRLVARHELLHVLGLGGATSWDVRIAGGLFTGTNARAANGGQGIPVDPFGGHFAQGVDSIMAPMIGSIIHPTAIDRGALDDIGWTVSASEPQPIPLGLVAGPGAGSVPLVKIFDPTGSHVRIQFYAYGLDFTGGVRVAVGDVNGDGTADIVTTPARGAQPVRVFDGLSGAHLRSFFAFPENPGFGGGITLAVADVNRDEAADILLSVSGGAGPAVRVLDGRSGAELSRFWAFAENPSFGGGVNLAAADVDADGDAEVIAAIAGGAGPAVRVLEPLNGRIVSRYWAFPDNTTFPGGVSLTAADVDADGRAEVIVTPAAMAPPAVRVLDGLTGRGVSAFWAFEPSFGGGVNLGATDLDADGRAEILTAPATGPRTLARTFDPRTGQLVGETRAYPDGSAAGVFVAGQTVTASPAASATAAASVGIAATVPAPTAHEPGNQSDDRAPELLAVPAVRGAPPLLEDLFAGGLDEELLTRLLAG